MTQEEIRTIHEEIKSALEAIGRKHNFAVEKTHITYDDEGFRLTASVNALKADGTRKADDRLDSLVRSDLAMYNVSIPYGIGYKFTMDGIVYEITNYNTRARKYPIEYKRLSDGAGFKAAPEYIAAAIKRNQVASA